MKIDKKVQLTIPVGDELVVSTARIKATCQKQKHGKVEVKALKLIAWENENKKATVTVTENKKGVQKITYSKAYKKLPAELKVTEGTIKHFAANLKQNLMELVASESGKKKSKG